MSCTSVMQYTGAHKPGCARWEERDYSRELKAAAIELEGRRIKKSKAAEVNPQMQSSQ
jgi:hypothetical protein